MALILFWLRYQRFFPHYSQYGIFLMIMYMLYTEPDDSCVKGWFVLNPDALSFLIDIQMLKSS